MPHVRSPYTKEIIRRRAGIKHALILKKPIAQVLVPRQRPHEKWHLCFIWTRMREHGV